MNLFEVNSLDSLSCLGINKAALAVGVFDGVHRGHRKLLDAMFKECRRHDAAPAVMTFFPHPRQVLHPSPPPPLLLSPERKAQMLRKLGVKVVISIPFSKSFAQLEPADFISQCLTAPHMELDAICIGSKWRFGSDGRGNVKTLKEFFAGSNTKVRSVRELYLDGLEVSSTAIRHAVSAGLLDEAQQMLGYRYFLSGKVVRGFGVAATELKHATANVQLDCGVLPPDGVYACFVRIKGNEQKYPAAVNIGHSPTYKRRNSETARVEAHLLGYCDSLYDQNIDLELLEYVRSERCFSSREELAGQIKRDTLNIEDICRRSMNHE